MTPSKGGGEYRYPFEKKPFTTALDSYQIAISQLSDSYLDSTRYLTLYLRSYLEAIWSYPEDG